MESAWDDYEAICSKSSGLNEELLDDDDYYDPQEARLLSRAYPDLYQKVLKVAHSSSDKNHGVVVGCQCAWEKSVVHNLASFLGLTHVSRKNAVQLTKPKQYQIPENPEFAVIPDVMRDVDIVSRSKNDIPFSEAITKHPHLHSAVVRFAGIKELSKIVFTAGLNSDEQAAVMVIANAFQISTSIFRVENSLEFVELSKPARELVDDRGVSLSWLQSILTDSIKDFKPFKVDDEKFEVFGSAKRAGVTRMTGKFILWLISHGSAQKTLEVGLANGTSALFFCEGLMKSCEGCGFRGSHTAIDPFQVSQWKSCGIERLQSSGLLEHVDFRFIDDCSEYALPVLCKSRWSDDNSSSTGLCEEGTFDIALIDGNHGFDHVFVDVFYCFRLLKTGGFLVLDDADMPSVMKVISFITGNFHGLKIFDPGCVFTFRKITEADNRPWRFLKMFEF
eukprot:TRINITY_DN4410_c0_g1_i9.p2 TRINITY_DN4410_c0_g1~~TRINITY_DN4410_c0_g1_i9.p2  ORF type:complete len:448 (+),score=117.36 TRINITY_DN4410_c0_g1_i9:143-1486(+)